jgi:hypothetical protein
MIIGSLGVLTDTTVTKASAVWEIHDARSVGRLCVPGTDLSIVTQLLGEPSVPAARHEDHHDKKDELDPPDSVGDVEQYHAGNAQCSQRELTAERDQGRQVDDRCPVAFHNLKESFLAASRGTGPPDVGAPAMRRHPAPYHPDLEHQ